MNKIQSQENQMQAVSAKNHSKSSSQFEEILSEDIYKVIDGQIVPTRAPSEVEQDISPGTPTRQE